MRALRSFILATGLVIISSAANAAVRVYLSSGPSGVAYYENAGDGYSHPRSSWIPAYYDRDGNYYPGRWVAVEGRHDHEWREHEWREHQEREWDRRGEGYRDERRDRDDRGHDRDDRRRDRDEDR